MGEWRSRMGDNDDGMSEGEYLATRSLCDFPDIVDACQGGDFGVPGTIVDYRDDPDAWVMRDGTRILIFQMGDGHLLNTLRLIRRKVHSNWPRLKVEIEEAAAAGITFFANPATMRAVLKGPEAFLLEHPKFQGMYIEADRRKLDLLEFHDEEDLLPAPYDAWWSTEA